MMMGMKIANGAYSSKNNNAIKKREERRTQAPTCRITSSLLYS
jgi:hypothetical protein